MRVIEYKPSNTVPDSQPGELVGREALRIRYGVSKGTIQRWLRMGISHHGDQHRYVFYADETDPWVEKYNAMRWKIASPTDEGDIIGDLDLGRHYGVVGETIRQWVKKGLPCRCPQRCRVYKLMETDPWVEEYRKRTTKNRKSKKSRR